MGDRRKLTLLGGILVLVGIFLLVSAYYQRPPLVPAAYSDSWCSQTEVPRAVFTGSEFRYPLREGCFAQLTFPDGAPWHWQVVDRHPGDWIAFQCGSKRIAPTPLVSDSQAIDLRCDNPTALWQGRGTLLFIKAP
jgi:hypothetical protein